MIRVGSDFSGVGAFNQSLIRLGIDYKEIFACDMDKYARQTFIENYRHPEYYPKDVYDREIPHKSLDIYMTSPPCQGFSMAGKREGSVLFYNSHEFIQKNKPRYFIFENVKGLLSHEGGVTFQTWIDYLGGKSVNGNTVIFPRNESVPYHIFYKVINAKKCGVPQNRERVFIVGIRDDADAVSFKWNKDIFLEKRLKDVLESDVDEKYFLSDKMIKGFMKSSKKHEEKGTGFTWNPKTENDTANCLRDNAALCKTDNTLKVGYINQNTQASQVFNENGTSPNICSGTHGYANGYVKIKSATKQGYEIATKEDSINFSVPNSETRRGRVGKGVAQTLDTGCNQGVLIGAIRGRNPENPKSIESGLPTVQQLEINENGTSNALTTVQKDNVVIQINPSKESGGKQPYQHNRVYADYGVMTTLDTDSGRKSVYTDYKIRRLTPRECFRLMDFPESFKMPCSDSQMYKQAGNSIVVSCLVGIIKNLNL